MEKSTTLVGKVQGINSTTPNLCWVNLTSPRFGLMSSTPYDSMEEAEKFINEYTAIMGNFAKAGENKWATASGLTLSIDREGDLSDHIKSIWVGVMANYGDVEDPDATLMSVLESIYLFNSAMSIKEKDEKIATLIKEYREDANVKRLIDLQVLRREQTMS